MKKTILLSLLLLISGTITVNAQVTVSGAHESSNGTYAKLSLAFAAINGYAQTGNNIVITITSSQTAESGSATLNAGAWTSLTIYPTASGLSISGSVGGPLIDLNGADHVTIDGRVNQSGSGVDLTISNTSTGGVPTCAIRFHNDATYNTVKYCLIKGSSNGGNSGILYFSTTTVSLGNSYNTIDNNQITNAGSRPINAIYSNGSSTASNNSNTISNNNFYDFLSNSGNHTCGILLGEGVQSDGYNSAWTISGNSFYETVTFSPNTGGEYRIINIRSRVGSTHGDNFSVLNNYIGGSGPGCTGTFYKSNGNNRFWAIEFHVGSTNASSVQGNVIKNMKYVNTGAVDWWGIYVDYGAVNIGTSSGNYIGSASDTGSIFYSCNGAGARFLATHLQGDATNFQNNVIGSITVANQNSANNTDFWGIHCQHRSSTNVISNNIVGSATVANSIKALSPSTSSAQAVIGIYEQDNQPITLNNNTIANLTNGTTNTTASTEGKIYGMYLTAGQYSMTGNSVHDLTIANANNYSGPNGSSSSLSAGGIIMSATWGVAQSISGNTVYNIFNTYSSFAGHVAGLYYNGGGTASNVSGNFIYGLTVNSSLATISGIRIAQGNTTFSNNIITLGGNTTTNLYGIYEAGVSGTSNIYFNTVYLNGSPSGSLNSACLYNAGGSTTRDFRNNVLDNARSGSGTHYAIYLSGVPSHIDYNDYYASGTGGKLGYSGGDRTTIAEWRSATGQDVNSSNTLPGFLNPGGTTATSYIIPTTILPAWNGSGISIDYAGTSRSSSPEMGAYERDATVTWTGETSTNWNTGSNWNSGAAPTSGLNVNIGSGTYQPHITHDISSPTVCNNLTIQTGCVLTIGPGKALTVNGTLTNSTGNSGLVIGSDETGTGSLIQHSASVGATVNRYITGSTNLEANKYHFVSIPVYYGSPTSNLFLGSYLYKLDATQVDPNNSNYYGLWVNFGSSTTTPLSCKSGYMIYYPDASHTYTFTGNLNTGSFSPTVSYGGTYTFNLVPNPYPSAIDWGASGGWVKSNIGATAWIWSATNGNYSTLSGPSYVPAGQAFIVMATGSPVLTVNNNACVHHAQAFYKSGQENTLKISAQSNNYSDETFVSFDNSASSDFDPQFDGFKLWGLEDAPQLWTEKGEFRLSVNQQPPPQGSLIVPLDFKTTVAGEVILGVAGVESFDPTLPIRLRDHLNGSMTDLRQNSSYTFNHDPSNSETRFSLVFGYPNGIGESQCSEGRAWVGNGNIFVEVPSMHGTPAAITVYDITGHIIRSVKRAMNGTVIVEASSSAGVYIVAITSEEGQYITRVIKK